MLVMVKRSSMMVFLELGGDTSKTYLLSRTLLLLFLF
jgi:hypothetical protein